MLHKPVVIFLVDDPNKVGDLIPSVSEPKVHVSKTRNNGETVVWTCDDGDAEIVFKDSPFRSKRFLVPLGGFVGSGLPVKGVTGKEYKYDILVTRPGDNREYRLDPQVVVDNGT